MSLPNELVQFVRSRPAFWTPIANAFSIVGSPTPPTDPRILARLSLQNAPQDAGGNDKFPYLVWTGPFKYEQNTTSDGAALGRWANFWFTAYTDYADDASDWIDAIEDDVLNLFVNQYFQNLSTVRIMTMTYVPNTKFLVPADNVSRTSNEFGLSGMTICYKIQWQNL